MTDIVLIQPPVRDFYLTAKRTIPYGLACIASCLLKEGFSVEIVDALATSKSRAIEWPSEMAYLKPFYGMPDVSPYGLFHDFKHFGYSYEHIGKLVQKANPFLVGISSLCTAYSAESLKIAEVVKSLLPKCKVVLGGHHPSALPESAMANPAVDYCLRGEGELAFPLLAKAIQKRQSVSTISGIVCRNPDGSLTIAEPACVPDLNSCPIPAFHLVNNEFYSRGDKGSAVIMASRGCPMHCSYCSVGASSSVRYRRRSVDSVMNEIECAVSEYNARFIIFEDENISMEKTWFLSLLAQIEGRFGNSLELRAMNGLFPPTLDRETILAMKKAGFTALNLSLGTTYREQLETFQRPDVTQSFIDASRIGKEYGLEVVGYIIAGAPGQKRETSVADLLFLREVDVISGVSIYYPSPGSLDFGKCIQAGLLPPHFSLMRSTALPISDKTGRIDSITILRLSRILNFMKSMKDQNIPCPEPEPLREKEIHPQNRQEAGIKLLASFLYDGIIRGITPKGEIFAHTTSHDLCMLFLQGYR